MQKIMELWKREEKRKRRHERIRGDKGTKEKEGRRAGEHRDIEE